jgi:hypothetical protein
MSWLLILFAIVVYCAGVAVVMTHLSRVREPPVLHQDDDAIAVLETRLHRDLKQAS